MGPLCGDSIACSFSFYVLNSPPTFNTPITSSFIMNIMQAPITYLFPGYTDPENHAVIVSHSASLPSFVAFTTTQITISPTLCSHIGPHAFDIILSDTN